MRCPYCQSERPVKNGRAPLKEQNALQRNLGRDCGKRYNERTNTPMARFRTPARVVSAALNVRSEGLGVRATGRSFSASHATIISWERRLAACEAQWSPPAPEGSDLTIEGDEVYTRVGENLPPR
jgi:transposase-like protein